MRIERIRIGHRTQVLFEPGTLEGRNGSFLSDCVKIRMRWTAAKIMDLNHADGFELVYMADDQFVAHKTFLWGEKGEGRYCFRGEW